MAKILYLAVGVFDKGGISRYCRYQIRALRELIGAENVRVLSFFAPGANDFEEPFAVDYHAGGPRRSSEVAMLWAGARHGFKMRPGLIWSSHLHFMPHALAIRALFARRAPIALNVYGRELWSGGRYSRLHRLTVPRADMIVADCHFSADFVVNDYRVPGARIRVLWDCVDTGRFFPRPKNLELLRSLGVPAGNGHRYLLTLGRLEARARYKGYDRMLDALAALKDHRSIVGLFAGDGDDRKRLERRAREAGLEDRAFFLGSVPEAMLPEVYNACDAFSLVSERGPNRGEGIPLTPLEAAACGKPIIVGNEDGSREAVADGESGWALSSADAGSYRARLLEVLLNDGLRERMGRAARRRIEAEFSYEGFRAKTARLLEELSAAPQRAA